MFYKVLEFLTRIFFSRRIFYVNKIGAAAKLAGNGDTEAALLRLTRIERKWLHPSVRSVLWLTRGLILDASGNVPEAEDAVIRAAKMDPSNMRAHLVLAKMSGRKFQFANAKARLKDLLEKGGEEIRPEVDQMLRDLEDIASGARRKELSRRAAKLAALPLGESGERAGLPANPDVLDRWLDAAPEEARTHADDIAILLGESAVKQGGEWHISLDMRHSEVRFEDGTSMNPFLIIAARLLGEEPHLKDLPFLSAVSPE